MALEFIQEYVEILDSYFGNVCLISFQFGFALSISRDRQVCELDLIFNFDKAYYVLNELCVGGRVVETNKREMLRVCSAQDKTEEEAKKTTVNSALSALGF